MNDKVKHLAARYEAAAVATHHPVPDTPSSRPSLSERPGLVTALAKRIEASKNSPSSSSPSSSPSPSPSPSRSPRNSDLTKLEDDRHSLKKLMLMRQRAPNKKTANNTTSSTIATGTSASLTDDHDHDHDHDDLLNRHCSGSGAPPSTSTVSSSSSSADPLNATVLIHHHHHQQHQQQQNQQSFTNGLLLTRRPASADDFLLDIVDVSLVGDVSSIASSSDDERDHHHNPHPHRSPGNVLQVHANRHHDQDEERLDEEEDEEDEDSGSVSVLIPWGGDELRDLGLRRDTECPSPPSGPPPHAHSHRHSSNTHRHQPSAYPQYQQLPRHQQSPHSHHPQRARPHSMDAARPHSIDASILSSVYHVQAQLEAMCPLTPSTPRAGVASSSSCAPPPTYPSSSPSPSPSRRRPPPSSSPSSSPAHHHQQTQSVDGMCTSLPRLPKAKVLLARKRTGPVPQPSPLSEASPSARKLVREYSHPSELLAGHVSMVVSDGPRTLHEAADAALRRHASRQQDGGADHEHFTEYEEQEEEEDRDAVLDQDDFPLATNSMQRYGRRRGLFFGGAGGASEQKTNSRYSGEEAIARDRGRRRSKDYSRTAKRKARHPSPSPSIPTSPSVSTAAPAPSSAHHATPAPTASQYATPVGTRNANDAPGNGREKRALKTGAMISGTVMRVSLAADPWIDFITDGQSMALMGGRPASAIRKVVRKLFGRRPEIAAPGGGVAAQLGPRIMSRQQQRPAAPSTTPPVPRHRQMARSTSRAKSTQH